MNSTDILRGASNSIRTGYPVKITGNLKSKTSETKPKETVKTHIRKIRCNCKKVKHLMTTTTMTPKQVIYNDFKRAAIALRKQFKIKKMIDKIKIILEIYFKNYIEENFTAAKKTSLFELIKSDTNPKSGFENKKDIKEIKELIQRELAKLINEILLCIGELNQKDIRTRVKREDISKEPFIDHLERQLKTYLNMAKKFIERNLLKYLNPLFDTFSPEKVKNEFYEKPKYSKLFPKSLKLNRSNKLKHNTKIKSKRIYEKIIKYGTTYVKNYNKEKKKRIGKKVGNIISTMQPFVLQQLNRTESKIREKRETTPKEQFVDYVNRQLKTYLDTIEVLIFKYLMLLFNKFSPKKANDSNDKLRSNHSDSDPQALKKMSGVKNLKNNILSKGINKNTIDNTNYINIKKHYNKEIGDRIAKEVVNLINKLQPLILQLEQAEPNARFKREDKPKEGVVDYVMRYLKHYVKIVRDFVDREIMIYVKPLIENLPPKKPVNDTILDEYPYKKEVLKVVHDFYKRFKNDSEPMPKTYVILKECFTRLREAAFGIQLNYDELIPKYTIKVADGIYPGKKITEDEIRPKWDHFKVDRITPRPDNRAAIGYNNVGIRWP